MRKYSNMSIVQDPKVLNEVKESTIQEIDNQIIDLKSKSRKINYIQGGLAFAGSVGGLVYAFKKNKSFWGKVGFWILGGLIVGVPTSVVANVINNSRNAEIEKLENEKKDIDNL